jgi:acetyltransferase-like isoleucine patch superfamily enzyme
MIYGTGGLKIGNDVRIATHVVITPAGHVFDKKDIPIRLQGVEMKGIVIEDDVWIGANATILDGVIIGRGCVIGAGSVVTKSLPEYSVAVGVPARVIYKRGERP